MKYELKQLSSDDGLNVFEMLQAIPKEEHGFTNECNGISYEKYKIWLVKNVEMSKGINLEDWMVPQSIYWLYVNDKPVGIGKIRHSLTDSLRKEGGHIGYSIHPQNRNLGYGKVLLKLLIEKSKDLKIDKLLLTIHNDNTNSIKTALSNKGIIEKIDSNQHSIWIQC